MPLELFDQLGRVKADIDPAAVEALTEAEQAILTDTLKACRAAEDAEERRAVARKLVAQKMRDHDAALAADIAAHPAPSHQEALFAVVAASRPGYKPEPAKINKKTKAALASAVADLAAARAEYHQSEAALKILSAKRGEAIVAWMKSQKPVTFESVLREKLANEQATKLAIATGELAAPVKPAPVFLSQLDRIMSGAARDVNRGNKRPVYRSR